MPFGSYVNEGITMRDTTKYQLIKGKLTESVKESIDIEIKTVIIVTEALKGKMHQKSI